MSPFHHIRVNLSKEVANQLLSHLTAFGWTSIPPLILNHPYGHSLSLIESYLRSTRLWSPGRTPFIYQYPTTLLLAADFTIIICPLVEAGLLT